MSVTQDQLIRLRSCGSAESLLVALKILLASDRLYFFGRCARDDKISALCKQDGSGGLGHALSAVLEVLCFGTYSDYESLMAHGQHSKFLENFAPTELMLKMKVLTFTAACGAAVASGSPRVAYATVAAATGLLSDDVRGVEELVLSAMSADLADCRMNQKERFVEVISVQAREVLLPSDTLSFVKPRTRGTDDNGKPMDDLSFVLSRLQMWANGANVAAGDVNLVGEALVQRQLIKSEHEELRKTVTDEVFRTELMAEKAFSLRVARDETR